MSFDAAELDKAGRLFNLPCDFMLSVADLRQLPPADRDEVAFAGRSNVGKSSLINALFRQKRLAKTSSMPGRTQQLNFFNFGGKLYIADLPGYGYARAPAKEVRRWQEVLKLYLRGRPNLRRVFLLIDSRHGIKSEDTEIMKLLDVSAVPYQIILTKTDKLTAAEAEDVLKRTQAEAVKHTAALSEVLSCSSEKNKGLEVIRAEICSLFTAL